MDKHFEELLTIQEVCRANSIGRTTVYKLIGLGRLTAIKVGRATRITRSSQIAFLASCRRIEPTRGTAA